MKNNENFHFIDLFAGCGGLSLGLLNSGWNGLLGIEKDPMAFETLKHNLLSTGKPVAFNWPNWLPQLPIAINEFLSQYHSQIIQFQSKIDLLVGGPPCQGFSSAGKRDPDDPRNAMVESYIEMVHLLKPKFILLENVRGITRDFKNQSTLGGATNYSKKLVEILSTDYTVWTSMLDASQYGVPQTRFRFVLIAQRKDILKHWDPFRELSVFMATFLRKKGIGTQVNSKMALSDLELVRNGFVDSTDTKGFKAINYNAPLTRYQKLMRLHTNSKPSDTRLARHRPYIEQRFKEIISKCHELGHLNISLKREMREYYGLKKQAIRVLDPEKPAPTITSLPDDLLHYSEPRTLTVRENARLQSFPDWFEFKGKYTTGGDRRKKEVPRFTQVANAVPPLLAEAIGHVILQQASLCATDT